MNISNNVRTAGVYVIYEKYFVFQVGPTKDGSKLGVVRLGGHREENESPLETAKREVFEEASVHITPINVSKTYYLQEWTDKPFIIQLNESIQPILVKGDEEQSFTVMYFGFSDIEPAPSSETHGLLLLSPEDVQQICQEQLTLNDYLNKGGRAIIKSSLNKDLRLIPFPQLQFLSTLISKEPDLITRLIEYTKS